MITNKNVATRDPLGAETDSAPLSFSQRTEVVAGPRDDTQPEQNVHCCRLTKGCVGAVAPLVVKVIFVFFQNFVYLFIFEATLPPLTKFAPMVPDCRPAAPLLVW